MINVVIQKSAKPGKKYDAMFNGTKTISFGASGYQGYTIHHDEKRKQNYIKRHRDEDWSRGNLESAAFLSRYILWEKPSLREAIQHVNTMYKDIHFKML